MRLNIRAMAFSIGVLWGAMFLVTGLANVALSGYGTAFLQVMASVYPGYDATGAIGDLIIGVLYALVDGWIFGLVFAWLYNLFLGSPTTVSDERRRKAGILDTPVEPKA